VHGVIAACVPSCTTCAYTTELAKSYSTCSVCANLYALTSTSLCSSKSPYSLSLSLSLCVCLHSSVSLLIADIGRAPLRSASERICDRSFSAAGCRAKNALPSYVRHDKNYSTFKKSLKGRYVYNNNNNNNKRICIAPQCRNFRDYNRSWRTVTN